ncbi:MAG: hypothetical protein E6713_10855 [Sporomusaceae bacterium]|nr:hypothetical protein [Sporomusaceae bacterium]
MSSAVKEKVAYLQGLKKGLNVNDASAEGKLLIHVIDALDTFAGEIEGLSLSQEELGEYVETIDDDLSDLEEEVYVDTLDDDYMEVECPEYHDHDISHPGL